MQPRRTPPNPILSGSTGHDRAEKTADGAGSEQEPERPRQDAERFVRVQDEDREETLLEEVDGCRGTERRADDRVAEHPAHAATTWPLPGASGGGSSASTSGGRGPRRRRSRHRRRASPAPRWPAPGGLRCSVRRCTRAAAPVHDRAALDQAVAWHECDVDRHVRHLEATLSDPIRNATTTMCGNVSASNGRRAAATRSCGPAEVGRDHDVPLPFALVGPGTRAEGQEEIRYELRGDEESLWAALASSVSTATSGSVIWLTWSPSSESVWPSPKRRNCAFSRGGTAPPWWRL